MHGVHKAGDSTTVTPSGYSRTSIAYMVGSTPDRHLDGDLFYAAMWNKALSLSDIAALAADSNPNDVSGRDLIFLLPMYKDSGRELVAWTSDPRTGSASKYTVIDVGSPTFHTNLPSSISSYMYRWPMDAAGNVPATAVGPNDSFPFPNSGINYLKRTSAPPVPVIADDPGPKDGSGGSRKALMCYSPQHTAHANFETITRYTDLEDDFCFAFDFVQEFGGTYFDQGTLCLTNKNMAYIGRYLTLVASRDLVTGDLDPYVQIRHELAEDEGSDVWFISPSRYNGSWLNSFMLPDYVGANEDPPRRVRIMVRYYVDSGTPKYVMWVQVSSGRVKIVDGVSIGTDDNVTQAVTLQSRPITQDRQVDPSDSSTPCAAVQGATINPSQKCWFSNVAMGTDEDDVWDYAANSTGGANNPIAEQ
ncbi:MAG: hypothetical protein HKN13_11055 [Rhodothermales bacterium]|nr:hypothetical protein [Rhodothermales bacterium]